MRVAFFAGLGGLPVLGVAGVVYQREWMVAASACGLLLVGFWQAVLWMYILPVVGVLVIASAVVASQEPTNTLPSGRSQSLPERQVCREQDNLFAHTVCSQLLLFCVNRLRGQYEIFVWVISKRS